MASKTFNRRGVLKTLTATAIGGGLTGLKGAAATGRPRIPTDYTPNLDQDAIYEFMASPAIHWDEPEITHQGYTEWKIQQNGKDVLQRKPIDVISATPDGTKIRLYWAVKESYEVTQGGQVAGHFDVVVAYEQQVALEIKRALILNADLLKNNPNVAKTIEDLFGSYDAAKDGDPWDYAKAKMTADPSISPDSFSVEYVFSLSKIAGTLVTHDEKRKAALGVFDGKSVAQLHEGTEIRSLAEHLRGDKVGEPALVKSTFIGKPPTDVPRKDPVHEVQAAKGDVPEKIIDAIVKTEGASLKCDGQFRTEQWPLLTLLVWPEFKFAWKDVAIDLGCGIHIILRLPWLYIRTSRLDLWVYARVPVSVAADIDAILTKCLHDSALSPAVLAVALFDLPAGIAAFLGLFTECVTEHALKTFSCLIPGLALISAVNPPDWP